MDKAQIIALADRVEALTGPEYSVQVAIFKALHPEYAGDEWQPFGLGLRHENDSSDVRTPPDRNTLIPRYLFSIDAAMTLVPEGWQFCVTNGNGAWVRFSEHHPTIHGGNAHPAIALTAASLRAMVGGDDGKL